MVEEDDLRVLEPPDFAAVERERLVPDDDEEEDFARVDFAAAGFDAVEPDFEADDFAAVFAREVVVPLRRVVPVLAVPEPAVARVERVERVERDAPAEPGEREARCEAACSTAAAPEATVASARPSRAATRRPSFSISPRRFLSSSSGWSSSTVARMRCAMLVTSSRSSWARSRPAAAPPPAAWKVRSTASRTASAGLPPFLPFLPFFSFLAMSGESSYVPGLVTPTVHLRPHAPVAPRALLPGDPGRALRLAQHLLEPPARMLNHHRGLWGYSNPAQVDGELLTVQSTGLGGPSAAAVIADLAALGVRRVVRVGTCSGAALGSVVVVSSARCGDGTSRALSDGAESVAADPELLARLEGERVVVASYDAIRPEAAYADLATAAVFAAAARHGLRAAALLIVARNGSELLPDDELHETELRAGDAAAAALAERR